MGRVRTAGLVLLVVLLAVDVAVANAAVAADRTVLDADFVTSTLAEEAAYGQVEPVLIDQLPTNETDGEGGMPPMPVDQETVIAAALDAEYVRSQVDPNVERAYAYLHGDADELQLVVDAEPAKAALVEAVETELSEASAGELLTTIAGGERNLTVGADGVELDPATVSEMADDEATFHAERTALRDTVRDRVVAALVEEAFAAWSDDALLALVVEDYDPDAHTDAEKSAMVAEREGDIRTAVTGEIEAERGEEIDRAVDDRLAEHRDAIRANVSASLDGVDPSIAEPTTDLLLVAVDGYVADVTHGEFSADLEAAANALAPPVADALEAELDASIPDRIDVDDELTPEAERTLETVRRIVGVIDLLALALPVAGLGLVGGLYLVSRSVVVSTIGAGIGLGVGGVPWIVVAAIGPGRFRQLLAGEPAPPAVAELALAIVGQVADAILLQSAVVSGLGALLLVTGLAVHFDLVDPARRVRT